MIMWMCLIIGWIGQYPMLRAAILARMCWVMDEKRGFPEPSDAEISPEEAADHLRAIDDSVAAELEEEVAHGWLTEAEAEDKLFAFHAAAHGLASGPLKARLLHPNRNTNK